MLGPNGAGKTSTVETLEGYRRPAAGQVRVLGLDPIADHAALSGRVGVMLQRGGVYPMLGPRRVLDLFAGYYPDPVPADELLDLVGLRAVAATPWRHLSGGEQQRLSLALALVGRPEVAFLDEPTAGVDPEGRIAVRAVVAGLKEKGVCVVLTTHELGEAEKMADRIVILSAGRVVLEGTPHGLTAGAGAGRRPAAPPVVTFGAPPGPRRRAPWRPPSGPGPRSPRPRRAATGSRPPTVGDARRHRGRGELPGRARRHAHRPGGGQDPRGRLLRDGRGRGGRPRAAPTTRRRRGRRRRRPGTQRERRGAGGPDEHDRRRPAAARRAQTGAEIYMTLRRGETLLLTLGHPRRVPALLLEGLGGVDADGHAGQLLRARHPGARRHVDGHGLARHRHRLRARLRRAQAPRRHPARPPAPARRQDHHHRRGRAAAGRRAAPGRAGPGLEPRWAAGPAAVAGADRRRPARLGRLRRHRPPHGRHAAGRGEPGRGQRPLSDPPAAGRHDRPALQAAERAGRASPSCCRPQALSSALHATLGSGAAVPAESWAVLAVWAVAAPVAAALTFRWE